MRQLFFAVTLEGSISVSGTFFWKNRIGRNATSCGWLFSRAVLYEENAKHEHQRTGDDPSGDGFMEEEDTPGQREKDHGTLQKSHHLE